MLTKDKIKANQALSSLSDDQITAISTLSENDEQAVIDQKIGELHGRYDEDIKAITGKEKPQGVKSYEHLKSVLGEYKTKVEGFSTKENEISTLTEKIKGLEKKIKEGSTDETLKQKLSDLEADRDHIREQYNTDKAKWESELSTREKKLESFQITSKLREAVAGLTFKPTDIIPEDVRQLTIDNSINKLMEQYQVVEEDGKLVFKDKTGAPVRNPNNSLQPYTATELLSDLLKSVIDTGAEGAGGGTKPPAGGTGGGTALNLGGAKSQMQANEMIEKYLMGRGLLKTSDDYQKEFDKLYKENNISKLPVK